MLPSLTVLTLVLVVCTLLPLWRHPHWVVRGMEFPRLQLAFIATASLLAQVAVLDLSDASTQGLATVTMGCVIWHAWWIAPYTRLWPAEVKTPNECAPERRLRILTVNVLTPNRHTNALVGLVRRHQPDILVTLESDRWWQDRLDTLEEDMPHTIKCPLDNLYGMHVYSRLPLADATTAYLVEDDVPSMHALVQLRTGDSVRMHFLHPAPPSPTENQESAERDAELVIVAKSLVDSDHPAIVTGDLNDVAWSATTRLFRKISGLLDPRVGRGMFNTFHAKYPFLRWPLDHLFHSPHFTLRSIRRLPAIGSDHFPLLTDLCFTPIRGADQDGLEAGNADRTWARSIARQRGARSADVPRPGQSLHAHRHRAVGSG